MKTIVIARYNEDATWIRSLTPEWDVCVYDKGTNYVPGSDQLRNIGREANTYLHWIVDALTSNTPMPEEVVFCQGNPFEHDPNFLIHLLDDSVRSYGIVWECKSEGELQMTMHGPGLLDEYCRVFGLTVQSRYKFSTGAQYRVSAEQITSRPLAFYEALLALTKIDPVAPYRLERLWPLIFGFPL